MSQEQKEKLIFIAKSLVGVPYKYGAKPEEAPHFFDCSSFTQYLFRQIGVEIPRSTILQADVGQEVKLEDIQSGDLIFMHGTQGFYNSQFPQGIGHAMVYTGDGKTIHAASKRVQKNPHVVEIGAVEERDLQYILETLKPLVVIKRVV